MSNSRPLQPIALPIAIDSRQRRHSHPPALSHEWGACGARSRLATRIGPLLSAAAFAYQSTTIRVPPPKRHGTTRNPVTVNYALVDSGRVTSTSPTA